MDLHLHQNLEKVAVLQTYIKQSGPQAYPWFQWWYLSYISSLNVQNIMLRIYQCIPLNIKSISNTNKLCTVWTSQVSTYSEGVHNHSVVLGLCGEPLPNGLDGIAWAILRLIHQVTHFQVQPPVLWGKSLGCGLLWKAKRRQWIPYFPPNRKIKKEKIVKMCEVAKSSLILGRHKLAARLRSSWCLVWKENKTLGNTYNEKSSHGKTKQ